MPTLVPPWHNPPPSPTPLSPPPPPRPTLACAHSLATPPGTHPTPPHPARAEFSQWGGFDFHTQENRVDLFTGAKGVEFWVQAQAGLPDMTFRVGNIKGVGPWRGGGVYVKAGV